jgi:hypothetical protein
MGTGARNSEIDGAEGLQSRPGESRLGFGKGWDWPPEVSLKEKMRIIGNTAGMFRCLRI